MALAFSVRTNNSLVNNVYTPPPPIYGSFSSSITQNITQNQVVSLVYNTADISASGVTCSLPSANINILESGVYKVLASLQCDRTSAGAASINMYPSINGVSVPNSATRVVINQNLESLMTVEWFLYMLKGQYVTIDTYSTVTGARALAIAAAPPVPLIPSIITTITKIS
jgi:hypothetical protein